jgi:thiamine biosynthesis lipoprotein
LKRPVLITLDGIAKGFAVDGAIKILKYHGISGGWVNAGGDLRVFGSVQLPVQRRGLQGEFTDLGIFRNLALATSTRTLNRDPRFPGIILGSEEDFSGADTICTVSAPSAWLADALTKVAVLTPAILRHSMIAKLGGIQIFPS